MCDMLYKIPEKIFQMISDQISSMDPENTKHSLGFSSILHNSGESSSRQENESSPKERLCVNLGNCSDSVRKSAEWQLVRQNVVQEGGGGDLPGGAQVEQDPAQAHMTAFSLIRSVFPVDQGLMKKTNCNTVSMILACSFVQKIMLWKSPWPALALVFPVASLPTTLSTTSRTMVQ